MFWKLQENILDISDRAALANFILSTERFTQFIKVREFEEAWSKWQGCKYSVFVNSGSSANLLIISLMKELYGWQDGDEIMVPAVTWVTNISPIRQCGLKPVFVDVNLKDFSFDYESLALKITPRTRAIFVTHLIGFPASIPRIMKLIDGRDIRILEDCCESHGASLTGIKVGNWGDCSSFSFYWGHHMTTVEGGMICTNDERIFKLALLKRSHGLARELREEHHQEHKDSYPEIDFNFLFLTDGFNVRNTELHAVLGLSQLNRLDDYIAKRNRNHLRFLEILKFYSRYLMLPWNPGISSFCLPFLFSDATFRNEFRKALKEAGIESRPFIGGNLLRQPFLRRSGCDSKFPNADFLHFNAFYIGNNQFVDDVRLDRLSDILNKFFVSI